MDPTPLPSRDRRLRVKRRRRPRRRRRRGGRRDGRDRGRDGCRCGLQGTRITRGRRGRVDGRESARTTRSLPLRGSSILKRSSCEFPPLASTLAVPSEGWSPRSSNRVTVGAAGAAVAGAAAGAGTSRSLRYSSGSTSQLTTAERENIYQGLRTVSVFLLFIRQRTSVGDAAALACALHQVSAWPSASSPRAARSRGARRACRNPRRSPRASSAPRPALGVCTNLSALHRVIIPGGD